MKKIIIHRSRNNQFYFTLEAKNGRVIATSETYTTKRKCRGGINSVISFFTDGPGGMYPIDIKIIDNSKLKK